MFHNLSQLTISFACFCERHGGKCHCVLRQITLCVLLFGPCPVAVVLLFSWRNANLAGGFAGRLVCGRGWFFLSFIFDLPFLRTNCVLVQKCFSLLTLLSGPSLSATSAKPEEKKQKHAQMMTISSCS